MRISGLLLTTLLSCVLLAAPAEAEPRPGATTDPAGDAELGGPDIVGASVEYDTTGTLTARITFATAPPQGSDGFAAVQLGTLDGSSCDVGLALGATLVGTAPQSAWSAGSGSGSGSRALAGATLTLTASDPGLGGDFDCVQARVQRSSADPNNWPLYDVTASAPLTLPDSDGDGVADRADKCPTQAAAGRADGCPPAAPSATPSGDPVPPAPTATSLERYDAAVAACPRKRSKARTRCLSRAKTTNRAGALLAAKRGANPFLGKAFFRPDIDVAYVCGGTCLEGWTFTDDRWVYRGDPEDGPVMVRCQAVTAKGDDDGCLRYRLSKDRRTAIVGDVRIKLAKGGRQLVASDEPKQPFTRVRIPQPGLRFRGQLNNIFTFGFPGGPASTSGSSEMTFNTDGRFVRDGGVVGSTNPGTDFDTSFTAISPTRRGSYAFEPGGTLAMTYDDGRVVRRSAFVSFGEGTRLGDPVEDGLFLNGSAYLPPD